jgi:pantoate--beta-alanine ligase
MQIATSIDALREHISAWRAESLRIAFVPTMGNLHKGHLSLVKQAQQLADRIVVSIFVNPLQFNDKNDLSAYPRTLDEDVAKLEELGCDLVFTPTDEMMYPAGMTQTSRVSVPNMDDKLCGAGRPGHFDGVATVVTKLFNLVQPDVAVFGEKDYQQCQLIMSLVRDLNMPIDIQLGETCREASGLAMSSRNGHLSEAALNVAPRLHQTLQAVKHSIEQQQRPYSEIINAALETLTLSGFAPEYLDIRTADTLDLAVKGQDKALRIFVAANLDGVRLIDNIACDLA